MGWWQYWQWSPPGVPTYSAVPNCGVGAKGPFVMAENDTTDSKKKAVICTLNPIGGRKACLLKKEPPKGNP